jgi:hypothetical protein
VHLYLGRCGRRKVGNRFLNVYCLRWNYKKTGEDLSGGERENQVALRPFVSITESAPKGLWPPNRDVIQRRKSGSRLLRRKLWLFRPNCDRITNIKVPYTATQESCLNPHLNPRKNPVNQVCNWVCKLSLSLKSSNHRTIEFFVDCAPIINWVCKLIEISIIKRLCKIWSCLVCVLGLRTFKCKLVFIIISSLQKSRWKEKEDKLINVPRHPFDCVLRGIRLCPLYVTSHVLSFRKWKKCLENVTNFVPIKNCLVKRLSSL